MDNREKLRLLSGMGELIAEEGRKLFSIDHAPLGTALIKMKDIVDAVVDKDSDQLTSILDPFQDIPPGPEKESFIAGALSVIGMIANFIQYEVNDKTLADIIMWAISKNEISLDEMIERFDLSMEQAECYMYHLEEKKVIS